MTDPDARQNDELREVEDALAEWRHDGDDFRSLPEMIADYARARAAEVVTRVKAIPTYRVITEDESLGYVVLAGDVLDALAADDRTDPA